MTSTKVPKHFFLFFKHRTERGKRDCYLLPAFCLLEHSVSISYLHFPVFLFPCSRLIQHATSLYQVKVNHFNTPVAPYMHGLLKRLFLYFILLQISKRSVQIFTTDNYFIYSSLMNPVYL